MAFNVIGPKEIGMKLKRSYFKADFSDWWLRYLLWNCPQMNVIGPHWWWVNIGAGNGLVLVGIHQIVISEMLSINLYNEFKSHMIRITSTFPWGQWVNPRSCCSLLPDGQGSVPAGRPHCTGTRASAAMWPHPTEDQIGGVTIKSSYKT